MQNRIVFLALLFFPLLFAACDDGPNNTITGSPSDDFIAPDRFTMTYDDHEVMTPIVTSHSLDEQHPDVDRIVLFIPGSGRNVMDKFDIMTGAAADAGRSVSTWVIGVQFVEDTDLGVYELEPENLYWLDEAHLWSTGYYAEGQVSGDQSLEISSFTVLDTLWTRILEQAPNTEVFIMTGNSAGGSCTQHYATATTIPSQHPDVKFGFLPSNIVSALYFTAERAVAGTMDQFEIPSASEVASCPGYNSYPFGLIGLNEYISQFSDDELRTRYASRDMIYFAGSEDHSNYGQCQLLMMGEDNIARNLIYYNYIQHVFGASITDRQQQVVVEGAEHPGPQIFTTAVYESAMLDWTPGTSFGGN
ncbi:hypothetical protein KQI52_05625 [bacterium]|nr:hypothetical protein [bacterium]